MFLLLLFQKIMLLNYELLNQGPCFIHSLAHSIFSINVCWKQKHKCLSEQMISSLNFRAVWRGVLPTVACRSVSHNCQFEANQITECSLATCQAFDTGSSLTNRLHPWGICSFSWERNFFLAELTGACFFHPSSSKRLWKCLWISETFPHSLRSVNTANNVFTDSASIAEPPQPIGQTLCLVPEKQTKKTHGPGRPQPWRNI